MSLSTQILYFLVMNANNRCFLKNLLFPLHHPVISRHYLTKVLRRLVISLHYLALKVLRCLVISLHYLAKVLHRLVMSLHYLVKILFLALTLNLLRIVLPEGRLEKTQKMQKQILYVLYKIL